LLHVWLELWYMSVRFQGLGVDRGRVLFLGLHFESEVVGEFEEEQEVTWARWWLLAGSVSVRFLLHLD